MKVQTRKITFRLGWSVVGVLLAGLAAADTPSADEVLACAARNAPERTLSQHLTLVTTDATGTAQTLVARAHVLREPDGVKLNLKILEPTNLSGTTFLVREQAGQDDMRIFVPALNRVRRVTGNMAARELWGTSFSYADIKQMFGAFADGQRTLLPSGADADADADMVQILPSDAESVPFHSVQAAIARQTCVPMRVDFLDADAAPIKSLSADPASITEFDGRHLALAYTMADRISGVVTTVAFDKLRFDETVSSGAFHPNGFAHTP